MLQCCICEDWFHEHHLDLPPSLQVLYSGFCCQEMSVERSCFVMLESMSLQ
jgi:hypothetical protein